MEKDYIYYNDQLYQLRYCTSKPQRPALIICAVALKLGDTEKTALLFRKEGERITVFDQPPFENSKLKNGKKIELIEFEKEMVSDIISNLNDKQLQHLSVICVVELYDGSCMVIPEAKIKKLL